MTSLIIVSLAVLAGMGAAYILGAIIHGRPKCLPKPDTLDDIDKAIQSFRRLEDEIRRSL